MANIKFNLNDIHNVYVTHNNVETTITIVTNMYINNRYCLDAKVLVNPKLLNMPDRDYYNKLFDLIEQFTGMDIGTLTHDEFNYI